MSTNLFPMFVKLEGRRCLVVGAGRVAEGKIETLLAAGAKVRVVAPKATRAVADWASGNRISWESREFKPADLDGAALVIAATSSPEAHERIYQEAQRRGIWCNVVDDPAHCDFYYPSVVRRGPLQIAVSTNGRSPALAQRLRKEFEAQFGPRYESWIERLGEARKKLFKRQMDPERRRRLLHRLASPSAFEAFANGNVKNQRSVKS
jgi:precorrin-2 dehydrogenase